MTLLRAISRSFTPLDSWIGRPFRIQKSPRTKKITRAFNVPCFRVKVAKPKRARGFRIDHSAGPNWPLCLRNNKRIAITPLIIEQSVFDTDSWCQARKTYRISKNSLIFFLTGQSAVTRFPEFVQIKFLLKYLFPQEFDPVDQARARGLTSLSPIERCRMHTEKHR
jgi:hypothetical protein